MKRNIFSYKGKADRSEFWIICLICIGSLFIAGPVIDSMPDNTARTVIILLYALLFSKVMLAVTIRRCNDLGLSGKAMFNPKNWLRIPFDKN